MLLFVDESGQDRTVMPYEVLAGVLIAEENLWNLVKAIRAAEKDHFGDYLRHLRVSEVKAKELLKKKMFRFAGQRISIEKEDLPLHANSFLRKGQVARQKGTPDSGATAKEMTAYGRSVLNFIDAVLDIAAGFDVQIIASVVSIDAVRSNTDLLEKDIVYLFERYYYYLDSQGDHTRGLVVFDEIEKSRAQQLIQQMASYFLGTHTGRFRSSRIIPEPFFVHSELTTGIFLADLAAYIIGWGWRLDRMNKPQREELKPFADKLHQMQFKGKKPIKDGPGNHELYGIKYIDDL